MSARYLTYIRDDVSFSRTDFNQKLRKYIIKYEILHVFSGKYERITSPNLLTQ